MTPQQRHIEAARTIVRPMLASYHVSPKLNQPSFDPYESIARALAEAENRAAWDGWYLRETTRSTTFACDLYYMVKTYGPRPTTENQA